MNRVLEASPVVPAVPDLRVLQVHVGAMVSQVHVANLFAGLQVALGRGGHQGLPVVREKAESPFVGLPVARGRGVLPVLEAALDQKANVESPFAVLPAALGRGDLPVLKAARAEMENVESPFAVLRVARVSEVLWVLKAVVGNEAPKANVGDRFADPQVALVREVLKDAEVKKVLLGAWGHEDLKVKTDLAAMTVNVAKTENVEPLVLEVALALEVKKEKMGVQAHLVAEGPLDPEVLLEKMDLVVATENVERTENVEPRDPKDVRAPEARKEKEVAMVRTVSAVPEVLMATALKPSFAKPPSTLSKTLNALSLSRELKLSP